MLHRVLNISCRVSPATVKARYHKENLCNDDVQMWLKVNKIHP